MLNGVRLGIISPQRCRRQTYPTHGPPQRRLLRPHASQTSSQSQMVCTQMWPRGVVQRSREDPDACQSEGSRVSCLVTEGAISHRRHSQFAPKMHSFCSLTAQGLRPPEITADTILRCTGLDSCRLPFSHFQITSTQYSLICDSPRVLFRFFSFGSWGTRPSPPARGGSYIPDPAVDAGELGGGNQACR